MYNAMFNGMIPADLIEIGDDCFFHETILPHYDKVDHAFLLRDEFLNGSAFLLSWPTQVGRFGPAASGWSPPPQSP
jgi:hypothetical protein